MEADKNSANDRKKLAFPNVYLLARERDASVTHLKQKTAYEHLGNGATKAIKPQNNSV